MKHLFLIFIIFICKIDAQNNSVLKDSIAIAKKGVVNYEDFGAIGDGKTDDIKAIAAAHAFANKRHLKVKVKPNATYYIGGKHHTVHIQTDTDFGNASFIIDDTNVENNKTPIFKVTTALQPTKIDLSSLKRNQKKVKINNTKPYLVTVTNNNVKHYIRYGLNTNQGAAKTDIFLVDEKGYVNKNAPIIWDFKQITNSVALPINKNVLTITGGTFTTIANKAVSKYNYYSRNFAIRRSNVVIDGMTHYVTGEGKQGAPYGGFINIENCAYVTVKNTVFTGHKTYKTIGNAKKPVSMGSYDIIVNKSVSVSFINCKQSNAINDRDFWGLMASNYSKNLLLDNCSFSRFDAHKGVANTTIKNSSFGHMGIKIIGTGALNIENTSVQSQNFISLRPDYGSTWQGDISIKNCVFIPTKKNVELISGAYSGKHNFGYTCYMPKHITIDSLFIDDSKLKKNYKGPFIFKDFNPKFNNDTYQETFPYVKTKKITLKNVTTSRKKQLTISENTYMFKTVKLVYK
jgi:hypothetical protein